MWMIHQLVSFESDIKSELHRINKTLADINRTLERIVREQKQANALFRKAYNLAHVDVEQEEEDFKEKWK